MRNRWAVPFLAVFLLAGCQSTNPEYCLDPDVCGDPQDNERRKDLSVEPGDLSVDPREDLAHGNADMVAEQPLDLSKNGPHSTVCFDSTVTANGARIELTACGPSTDGKEITKALGAMPWVIVSPGFSTDRKQYKRHAERMASWGVVAFLQKSPNEWNHARYRDDTVALIAFLLSPTGSDAGRIAGRLDKDRVGLAGHSLGGKISFLVAQTDARVKALWGLDPVDQRDPRAEKGMSSIKLPPGVPIGYLGEVVSKTGTPPCAPGDSNYEVLYRVGPSPALAITVVGAAHMDFVDDPGACGTCGFCKGGTAPKERTNALSVKYMTAYFLSTIGREKRAIDTLAGVQFQKDVAAGFVTKVSK